MPLIKLIFVVISISFDQKKHSGQSESLIFTESFTKFMLAIIHFGIVLLSSSKNVKVKIYKAVILLVILGFLILREDNGLKVSENRLLRRILVHTRGEITGN
jgi:hypothetical protein